MTRKKSYLEIFVSDHPTQEKEEKGAPLNLNKKTGIWCSFSWTFESPDEDSDGINSV